MKLLSKGSTFWLSISFRNISAQWLKTAIAVQVTRLKRSTNCCYNHPETDAPCERLVNGGNSWFLCQLYNLFVNSSGVGGLDRHKTGRRNSFMCGLYAAMRPNQPVCSLCYWTLIFVTGRHSIPEQIKTRRRKKKGTDGRSYLCQSFLIFQCEWIEERQETIDVAQPGSLHSWILCPMKVRLINARPQK